MECWLASFPRSGNTYFRNILYYVYGIESSTWHRETAYDVDENYDSYRFVKTHLLPNDLIPDDSSIPAIYLVRDGRDAMVSIAHHRKDLVEPGSDFHSNLLEAIVAAEGSFFGGWSKNAYDWIERAELVIRYEDLIADPKAVFKRVEKLIKLPAPAWDKLPGFEEMKRGKPMYGGISKITNPKFNPDDFAGKFFRSGKSGGWQNEITPQLQDLFWNHHGDMMERLGYAVYPGSVGQNPYLDYKVMQKMGLEVAQPVNESIKIYIEATKIIDKANDGIKRYLEHLLTKFIDVGIYGDPRWKFKYIIAKNFYLPETYKEDLQKEEIVVLHPYEKILLNFKSNIKNTIPPSIYKFISGIYKFLGIRFFLKLAQRIASVKPPEKTFRRKINDLKNEIDIIHIPLPQDSENYKSINQSFLFTVHDLTHKLFADYHEDHNIKLAEAGMKFIEKKNTDVIAVSKNTIEDLTANYKIDAAKIHLVYESPDRNLFKWNLNRGLAEIIRAKYSLGSAPYFLCLSTIEPRKNLPNTIRAFNRFIRSNPDSDINLVISGNYGWKTEHLSQELLLDNPRIIFTGFVTDNDLPIIYSESVALCYISFYEGFGLPPLEAMSCRTPVIYGNNSSMKELIGDCGLPADPNDINNIMDQMQLIFFNNDLREHLAVRSHHRSFEFSWRKTIYDTLKVYEAIFNNKK